MEHDYNFTPRAQQVLELAREEADRFNHNFVGTEHVLLGLIKLGQGVAVQVLRTMGLDLETVRIQVLKHVGSGPDQRIIGIIPYTPRTKRVLSFAAQEAEALDHSYVGTEHILLGILREGDGVAARVLKSLDFNIEAARQEVLKELDSNIEATRQTNQVEDDTPTPHKVDSDTKVAGPASERGVTDRTKRYDVYCREDDRELVVYRSVLFRGVRLLPQTAPLPSAAFIELEHADGTVVFVAQRSIVKFCDPGVAPGGEPA